MPWACFCGGTIDLLSNLSTTLEQNLNLFLGARRFVYCNACEFIMPTHTFDKFFLGCSGDQFIIYDMRPNTPTTLTSAIATLEEISHYEFTLELLHWQGRRDSAQDITTELQKRYHITKKVQP